MSYARKTLAEAIAARVLTSAQVLELAQTVVDGSPLRYRILSRVTSNEVPETHDQCGSFWGTGVDKVAYSLSPFLSDDTSLPFYLIISSAQLGSKGLGVFLVELDQPRIERERAAQQAAHEANTNACPL